ncbi:hypothetical protein EMMF5_000188 [Cystobasidiomycetes sp. EMM_F5]
MAQFIQDHTVVVIGNKQAAKAAAPKITEAKKTGSAGLSAKLDNQTAAKLDDNEVKAPKTIGIDVGNAIQQARMAKGLKTKDLADQLAVQKSIITDLESGRHKHDNKLLQRLENKLGVWLTGDSERLGQPKTRESKTSKAATTPAKAATSKKSKVEAKEDDKKIVEDGTDEQEVASTEVNNETIEGHSYETS